MKTSIPLSKWLAAGSVLCLSSTISFADSISPVGITALLPVGGNATITKTVTVTKGTPTTSKVDVFFMADTTGSMGGIIAAVKTSAASILATASGLGDVAFGVGEYKDDLAISGYPDPYAYRLNTSMTTTAATVLAGIDLWGAPAGSGGDTPEAQLYALSTMASDPTTGWRPGSSRLVVWFGDAPGHDPSLGATLASTSAALVTAGVKVLAIDVGTVATGLDSTGQATTLATDTGGSVTTGISDATVVAAITSAITTSFAKYTTVSLDTSEAPAGVSVMKLPAGYIGAFDRSVDRTFDFEVTFTGVAPGDYTFNIYGTVDGGRVATEEDHFIVPGAGVPDGGSSILLLSLALGSLVLVRRKANRRA